MLQKLNVFNKCLCDAHVFDHWQEHFAITNSSRSERFDLGVKWKLRNQIHVNAYCVILRGVLQFVVKELEAELKIDRKNLNEKQIELKRGIHLNAHVTEFKWEHEISDTHYSASMQVVILSSSLLSSLLDSLKLSRKSSNSLSKYESPSLSMLSAIPSSKCLL